MTDLSLHKLNEAMLEAAQEMRDAERELTDAVSDYASKDRTYRIAKAQAILTARAGEKRPTIPEIEATADKTTADERFEMVKAEGMKNVATEKCRNRRQMLSMWQSLAAAYRMEAEMAGKNYEGAA